jgi:hypothetical protein
LLEADYGSKDRMLDKELLLFPSLNNGNSEVWAILNVAMKVLNNNLGSYGQWGKHRG